MADSTSGYGPGGSWMDRAAHLTARLRTLLEPERDADPADAPLPPRRRAAPDSGTRADGGEGAGQLTALAGTAASAALAAQLVRPRSVHWPRAVLAGTIATLAYDAETVVETVRGERKFGTSSRVPPRFGFEDPRAQLGRLAAGIGMAGFYAAFVHGRLPGPSMVHGMLYGAAEAVTRGWGGPAALLARLLPEARIPVASGDGLARDGESAGERLRRHLVFGAVVAVVYAAGTRD
jgi:hypothetical protein